MYIFRVLLVGHPASTAVALALLVAAAEMKSEAPGGTASDVLTPAQVAARVDQLWPRRDDPAALAQQKLLLDQALVRAPNDYGLLWRAGRYWFWVSDEPDLSKEERTRRGKIGWDIAERAVAANPNHVAGHFWAVGTMGNYALGIGVMRALTQRIEGKFKERITRAGQLDPGYAHGGIPLAWGRYYAKLPWPKYDQKKARAHYAKALEINPANLRARVFLADLMLEEDQPHEAHRLLQEVLRAPVGKYDAPEEKRAKVLASRLLPKVQAKL